MYSLASLRETTDDPSAMGVTAINREKNNKDNLAVTPGSMNRLFLLFYR